MRLPTGEVHGKSSIPQFIHRHNKACGGYVAGVHVTTAEMEKLKEEFALTCEDQRPPSVLAEKSCGKGRESPHMGLNAVLPDVLHPFEALQYPPPVLL